MGEESKPVGAVAAILAALPSDIKGILGFILLYLAFFVMIFAVPNIPPFLHNLATSYSAQEPCWEIKEVQSVAFKFNKCTGEAVMLETKTPTPTNEKKLVVDSVPKPPK